MTSELQERCRELPAPVHKPCSTDVPHTNHVDEVQHQKICLLFADKVHDSVDFASLDKVTSEFDVVLVRKRSGSLPQRFVEPDSIIQEQPRQRSVSCRDISGVCRKSSYNCDRVQLCLQALRQFNGRNERTLRFWRFV